MRTYRELLAVPGVLRLLFAATFPRLAYAMVGLSVFFHVQHLTNSVGTAGLALGAMGLLGALSAAPRGHIVDRWGQTVPILVLAPLYTAANILLATKANDARTAILLALLVGATAPPINMSVRPLWAGIVGLERLRTAYALDSAVAGMLNLLGPVLATLVALHISSRAALLCVAGSMAIGGVLLASNPASRHWIPEAKVADDPGILRSAPIRLLAVEAVATGMATGFISVGIPAMATLQGDRGAAGPLMAAIGVGSILGSIWAGMRSHGIAPLPGLRGFTAGYALVLLPLAFVPIGPIMMALLVIAYLFTGPAIVFYFETLDIVRPRGTAVAALGTLWMIQGSSEAIAAALGGNIAEWVSPNLTLGLASLFACVSPLVLTLGMRRVLRPALQTSTR